MITTSFEGEEEEVIPHHIQLTSWKNTTIRKGNIPTTIHGVMVKKHYLHHHPIPGIYTFHADTATRCH